jgi:hypothetical protein
MALEAMRHLFAFANSSANLRFSDPSNGGAAISNQLIGESQVAGSRRDLGKPPVVKLGESSPRIQNSTRPNDGGMKSA